MRGLHLGGLWGFALVQPLFALLGDQAEFFVARGSGAADIVIFAVALCLLPPAAMALSVWLAGRVRPSLGSGLQAALVGLLVAAILLPPAGELLGGSAASVPVAAALGSGAALLYARAAPARAFATVISPAPLLFLVVFLVVSPVSDLVLPAKGAVAVAGAGGRDTPVVLLVFDELPTSSLMDGRDRIDARRFPAFASVAADATWYRDATTVAGRTTEAVPALLTGRRPRPGELPTAAHHPRSLFTLLGRSHRLTVVEPITDVCPRELCAEQRPAIATRLRALVSDLKVVSAHLLLPEDLRSGLPPIDRDWQGFADQDRVPDDVTEQERSDLREAVGRALATDDPPAAFGRILRAIEGPGRRPPLLFLHTSLPHSPWRYLPDGRRYPVPDPVNPGLVEGSWVAQWLADQAFQRHLLQTQYADRLLGRLLDGLRSSGVYDRALVVVMADHGAGFVAGERRRVATPGNLGHVAAVPLFIKAPRQHEARVKGGAVRTIDVLPTIAEELGVALQGPVDGVPVGERDARHEARIDVPDSLEGGATGTFGMVLRQRAERERHERALLRRAGGDLYAIGPRPRLVGRRVGALPAGGGRVRLDASYRDVRRDAAVVPAFVSGTVTGLAGSPLLAVAVNGRIEATTRLDRSSGRARFTALVRPRSLRAGANRIEVLEIDSAGQLRALAGH